MRKEHDDYYYAHADQRVSMLFDKHAKAHRTEYEHRSPLTRRVMVSGVGQRREG